MKDMNLDLECVVRRCINDGYTNYLWLVVYVYVLDSVLRR